MELFVQNLYFSLAWEACLLNAMALLAEAEKVISLSDMVTDFSSSIVITNMSGSGGCFHRQYFKVHRVTANEA